MAEKMNHLGIPKSLIRESVRRLIAAKMRVAKGPVSRAAAYYAPFLRGNRQNPTSSQIWDAGIIPQPATGETT
jgi:hypothetical protein